VLTALTGGHAAAPDPKDARSARLAGRAGELAVLGRAWASLRAGAATIATIEGSSGIGKTALAEFFTSELPAHEALVLRARCHPHELVPFEALDEVVDDLSRYLSSLPAERLEALLPRDTAALQRVFPVLGRIPLPSAPAWSRDPGAEPHELRRRGFEALRELLGRLADRRPLVIWIDDLQWADLDSGPLLRELLRPPDAPPILWILSFRSEDRDHSPLLREIDKLLDAVPSDQRHEIQLGPLTRAESEELVRLLVASPVSPESAATLAAESGGSPFLLTELLKGEGAARGAELEPIEVGAMIRRRVDGLAPEARRLLEALSVAAGPLERRVALAAVELDAPDPDLSGLLESTRLIRSAARDGASRVEIYHDQIRDVIERGLSPDARSACHAALADALERHGSRDPALLFTHHAGAGRRAAAAGFAVAAGAQAAAQLAFDQAARFYRAALEQDRGAVDACDTLTQLGDALANAGRGPQAAQAFEEAAAEAAGADAAALLQRAAEQYLVCGRLADGRRVLAPLLARHGVRYPATTAGAMAGALARVPRLALRYFGRPGGAAAPSLAPRNDASFAAARGLLVIDPARATYFSVIALADALATRDAFRIGRALCALGGTLAPLGGPAGAWARAMLARAERLAEEVRDPRLDGTLAISKAQVEFVDGRFASMLELSDRGGALLVENCRGVRWDCDVAQMAALRALEELGRIDELRRRLPKLIEEAVALDDLYAEVTFRLNDAFWRIPRGEIDEARREADDVLARWSGEGFQVQHFYALRIQACCDVYEGARREAWQRVGEAWPALRRSGLLAHRMLKSDALQLRARVALSAADAGAPAAREVERSARALQRMQRPDAIAAACTLRAGWAARGGERASALALLARAEAAHADAAMQLHVAYARRRRGELLGGAEGDALVWQADRVLEAAGVRDPGRWLELQAPGFPSA
jgi:hypothetical protein